MSQHRGTLRTASACGGLGLVVVLTAASAFACGRSAEQEAADPRQSSGEVAPSAGDSAGSDPGAPAAAAEAGFERIPGNWQRTDGGYILEIWAVSPEGKVEAAYLNPRPIHIARAQAFHDGEAPALVVELQDDNYPGSTYQLRYDASRDVLEGFYFQAAEQQVYQVAFERQ